MIGLRGVHDRQLDVKPSALPSVWRDRADQLEPYAPAVAVAFRTAAAELEQGFEGYANEALDLDAATGESGYSREHLLELLRTGKLTNVGGKRRPKIRRVELPKKCRGVAPHNEDAQIRAIGDAARASRMG